MQFICVIFHFISCLKLLFASSWRVYQIFFFSFCIFFTFCIFYIFWDHLGEPPKPWVVLDVGNGSRATTRPKPREPVLGYFSPGISFFKYLHVLEMSLTCKIFLLLFCLNLLFTRVFVTTSCAFSTNRGLKKRDDGLNKLAANFDYSNSFNI